MKLNIHIIFDELRSLNPVLVTGKTEEKTEINTEELNLQQVRLSLPLNGKLEKGSIYLLSAAELAESMQLLSGIDLIVIGDPGIPHSQNLDLSMIIIPATSQIAASPTAAIAAVFSQVQDIFSKYNEWDFRLMQSIANREPLQTIADKAATVLENPFAIQDVAMANMLRAGKLPEDVTGTIWEVVLHAEYAPVETYADSPDALYSFVPYNRSPRFPTDANYDNVHVLINIYLAEKLFAILAAADINAAFTQGQISLMCHVRDVIEFALASSIEFTGKAERLIYYIENLIKGFVVDDKALSLTLLDRGWNIADSYRLYAIANPNDTELSESQARFCIDRLERLSDDSITFLYDNAIILITRQPDAKDDKYDKNDESYRVHLSDTLTKLSLVCGYSQIFDRFSDIKSRFPQAEAALHESQFSQAAGSLWSFDDLYFQHMMHLLNSSTDLLSLCDSMVLRLHRHDIANSTDYVQCLRAFLSCGCNVSQTGKALFMHRNTLVYRLKRICEIIKRDAQELSELEKLQLWFSCLICEYLS